MQDKNRSGSWVNNLSGDAAYKSFSPVALPPIPNVSLDEEGMQLLVKANKALAFLDGVSSLIPSLPVFISMYVRKEALLSSQIEGTQATLEDVLDPDIESNINSDVGDVINYIRATDYAIDRLNTLPLCNRLIKETHKVLMEGVRGNEKTPGEFRISQNWIGGSGSSLKNARYIPPNPEDMLIAMSDLEKYFNNSYDETDPLIKAALIHYQFETIHPFLDGNGRIGRLLITLFLLNQKVLSTPAIYISYFLKRNRIEYYDRLSEVRRTGDYEQWVKFFLLALLESAENAIETIRLLSKLHDDNMKKISQISSNQNVISLFLYLEGNPIIEIQKTAKDLNLAYNTVAKAVSVLSEMRILSLSEKRGRTRVYIYKEYLDILKKED